VAQSRYWSTDLSAAGRLLDERAPTGGLMIEHQIRVTEKTPVYRIRVPIAFGGRLVFSAWIRIPKGFRGRQVGASIAGFYSNGRWTANLKSHEQWQRVWVRASLPVDSRCVSCDLVAEGSVGDVFHSASWCLERGDQPVGYGFTYNADDWLTERSSAASNGFAFQMNRDGSQGSRSL
jgi:hypothetical protein